MDFPSITKITNPWGDDRHVQYGIGHYSDERLPEDFQTEFVIQEGFSVSLMDFSLSKPLAFSYDRDKPLINFGFALSGRFSNSIPYSSLEFENRSGISGILCLPRQKGHLRFAPDTPVKVLHVHLSPTLFRELFLGEEDTLPEELVRFLESPSQETYSYRSGISRKLEPVLLKAFEGPGPGMPKRLFYQAVALDLMAGQIAAVNRWGLEHGPAGLCRDEKQRVMEAARLLTRDFASPPGLKELAGRVGLNRNKLEKGFHGIYGVSVFRYLSQCRMQEAFRLFRETDMNVTQAASAVGYTNVSHFSRAYSKVFGILPKKHLFAIRKRF